MKPSVLIADKDVETGEIFGWYFRERGFEVETASNEQECLAKLRRFQPEVLVIDTELSRDKGQNILDGLRDGSSVRIPSLVLIGDPEDRFEIHRETAHRVADSLNKPFKLSQLLESVRAAVVPN